MVQDKMEYELKIAIARSKEIEKQFNDMISQIAISYSAIENPTISPEMIINNYHQLTKEMKDSIQLNCDL